MSTNWNWHTQRSIFGLRFWIVKVVLVTVILLKECVREFRMADLPDEGSMSASRFEWLIENSLAFVWTPSALMLSSDFRQHREHAPTRSSLWRISISRLAASWLLWTSIEQFLQEANTVNASGPMWRHILLYSNFLELDLLIGNIVPGHKGL